jgi:GH24 family phage-related lysozyme (muramidase)
MKKLLLLIIALLFAFNLKAQVKEDKLRNDTIYSITDSITYDSLHSIVIENLKKLEGLRLKPYNGVGGKTIGYGHQIDKNFTKRVITTEQADSILRDDFQKSINLVIAETGFNKNNNPEKLLALSSFAFNVGGELFLCSTLLLCVKKKKSMKEIKAQFDRWVHMRVKTKTKNADGTTKVTIMKVVNPNLKKMRKFEYELYSNTLK